MKQATSLLYHDVIGSGEPDSSGFKGRGPAVYKLDYAEFERHLQAIADATHRQPTRILEHLNSSGDNRPLFLTFDDGGVSAYTHIASSLESRGWRGHFFITTDFMDTPTFVSRDQVRDLQHRGHIIGSHSCSHPSRMSECSNEQLGEEWRRSRQILTEVTGEQVCTASLPAGYYSHDVARAASAVGFRVLFTSEPQRRSWRVDGCLVLGRYTVWRGMSAATAAGFASDTLTYQARQYVAWNSKKLVKKLTGSMYLKVRAHLLRRR